MKSSPDVPNMSSVAKSVVPLALGHSILNSRPKLQKPLLIATLLIAGLTRMTASLFAGDLYATATLQPTQITLGEAAQLNVTIEGSATVDPPEVPKINGLDLDHVGQSTSLQFVNGAMSGGVTYIYRVVPRKEGAFTIPEIRVTAGGKVIKTNPITLTVSKPSSSYSIQAPYSGNGSASAPQSPPSNPSSADNPQMEAATIQLIYPQRDFYVGESVSADLKVYLRQGLQISSISLPLLSGNAFTAGKLGDRPEQKAEIIGGVPYTVLTWHTTIAAVQSGEHPLGAQIECMLLVRDPSRHRSGPFGSDFFDDFFGGVQQKRVTLQTNDATVKVLPLPSEGQPSDFSGAIGHFEFKVEASSKEVQVGDPITLKMAVIGSGNFDRIQSPQLSKNQGFKIYQPSSKFEAKDETGISGQKNFEQVVIPQITEVKQIPEIRFSFFDPQAHKYVILSSPSIPLQVSPGHPVIPPSSTATVASSSHAPAPTASPSPGKRDSALLPNTLELGPIYASTAPLFWKPWFWGMPSLSVLSMAIAWGIARRRDRLANDPRFARAISANRIIRAQLDRLEEDLKRGDPPAFFQTARRALQERLGQRLGVKPETITFSEVEASLQRNSPLTASIQKIFEAADAVSYSGQLFDNNTLHEWKRVVLEALRKIEEMK